MLLASLLTLVAVLATLFVARLCLPASLEVHEGERLLHRAEVANAERARFRVVREAWTDTSEVVETAVEVGKDVTKASHQAIAAIPFSILEAIPGTSEQAKVVREHHDDIAGSAYGAIGAVNQGLGAAIRGVLGGRQSENAPSAAEVAGSVAGFAQAIGRAAEATAERVAAERRAAAQRRAAAESSAAASPPSPSPSSAPAPRPAPRPPADRPRPTPPKP